MSDFPRTMLFRATDARSCETQIVQHEGDLLIAKGQGWRESPEEAQALLEGEAARLGDEAAYRAHDDRNMSEKAQREVEAYEKTTTAHVPEIPEEVKRPKGRPKKAT
jgi:hypothetical protein